LIADRTSEVQALGKEGKEILGRTLGHIGVVKPGGDSGGLCSWRYGKSIGKWGLWEVGLAC